jgi:spore coat polysaccharide biosynthesis protein SpsF
MNAPRTVVVVQARMGSTRLPGKVLQDLHGRPLLERQVERLRRARSTDAIVIATTTEPRDDALVELAASIGVAVFRGDEHDVLARYAGAAAAHAAEVVVRVTADCPLIDPDVLDRCVRRLQGDDGLDYVSNTLRRTYPRGLDVEVLRRATLDAADREATDPADREHVTRFVWRQPERFRLANVADDVDHSDLRWTVDTPADLALVRAVYADLYPADPAFGYAEALRHALAHPHVHALNAHVAQKPA